MAPSEQRTRARGSKDLRTLKWVAVILPVLFVVIIEVFRFGFVEASLENQAGHILVATITIVAVVAFSLLMFSLIERAQREVVRRNRELAAMNAVSTAVQGELTVEEIIDAALRNIIESTGAVEAAVSVFGSDGRVPDGTALTRRVMAPGRDPVRDPATSLTEVPLSTGSAVVGRMLLRMPADTLEPRLLSPTALQNIAHQLASAIQVSQLVADLDRRGHEMRALYDVALQVTSQYALADILGAIVRHARDLLLSDEAVLPLSEPVSRSIQLEGASVGLTPLGDGVVGVSPDPVGFANLHAGQDVCPVRSSPVYKHVLEVPLRSSVGSLGDLWVGRRGGTPYTERDREVLIALADLAAIAITTARGRENERLATILTERERIAREMHDSLAQVLGATHLRLRALEARPEIARVSAVAGEVGELAELTAEAYRDVRESILGLRESSRPGRGLIESLEAYVEKFSHRSGVRATLHAPDGDVVLSPTGEIQVIRVIQEALTNVRKHAGATSATVTIASNDGILALAGRDDGGRVTITIADNGRGFDVTEALLDRDEGFGLHTMRERMQAIGGTLTVDSKPGRGTRVIAMVPVRPPAPTPPPSEVSGATQAAHSRSAR